MATPEQNVSTPATPAKSGWKRLNNLRGMRFGHLLVGSRSGSNLSKQATWSCVCDCGRSSVVVGSNLLSGNSTSCGKCLPKVAITDLTGRRFGSLAVTAMLGRTPAKKVTWSCVCDCGKTCVVIGAQLSSGRRASCVDCVKAKPRKVKDITGRKFGRLTVISRVGKDSYRNALWLCSCDCDPNKTVVVSGHSLLRGNTKSCSCLRNEKASLRFTTHGHTRNYERTGVYRSWRAMMQRATDPNTKAWKDYGGRGITVCEWYKDFSNFLTDLGPRPKGLSLDRIDNEKGYEPGNCQWADRQTQNSNQRLRANNTTGYSGVYARGERYCAAVTIDGEKKYLGTFPLSTEGLQAAAEAIKKAKQLVKALS